MTSRIEELEWLIAHEPKRELRLRHIREFNDLWEKEHGAEKHQEMPITKPAHDERARA